ncbi:NAD(P)-binding protein [Xylariomycetidae sp. FL2044]|nr:NAD(P)-binding protein [Xylariomycetidae sp. FL2044]
MSRHGTQDSSFDPSVDIPSLEGKVILVTGANSGLGRQASLEFAKHKPCQLWMAARDQKKGGDAVTFVKGQVVDAAGVEVNFLQLDLSSFASIKSAVRTVMSKSSRLDILMLNAGLMGCAPKLTEEGYEIQMGTNHVGHALLLKLLEPLLLASTARVVSMASSAWKYAGPEKIQFDTLKSLDGVTPVNRYVQSKAANMLYAQGLAKHYPQLIIASIDPGEVATQLFSREPGDAHGKRPYPLRALHSLPVSMIEIQTNVAPKLVRPVEEGVKNQLWAATSAEVKSGQHYEPVGQYRPEGLMLDSELAKQVWDWTQKELDGQTI